VCEAVTDCYEGEYVQAPNTGTSDRACRSCDGSDSYSDTVNAEACRAVGFCGANHFVSTRAKPTSDLVCSPCPPGLILEQDKHREGKCAQTTTTTATMTTATGTTSTSTSTVGRSATQTSSLSATATPTVGGTARVTLVFSKLDFDAVDLADLEPLLRTVLGEYKVGKADEISIKFSKGSIVAVITPDTERDAATIRDNAASITRRVQARASAGESKQDAPSTSTMAAEAANGDGDNDSSSLDLLTIIVVAACVVVVVVLVAVGCSLRARPSAVIINGNGLQSFQNPMYDATSPSLTMYAEVDSTGLSARSGYQDVKPDPHAYMDVRPDPHSIADEDDSDGELAV